MRSHLKVYFSFEDDTQALTDAEKGNLLLSMLRYAKDGKEPQLTGNERFLFPVFRAQMDRDIEVYDTKTQNGGRGGRPKTEINRTEPNITEINRTEPKQTETPKIEDRRYKIEDRRQKIKESGEFSPPTEDEVREYCRERGNRISPERFIAYYQARGWKDIMDWRACVRAWEQRDRQPSSAKQVSAQMYGQRDYTGEDSLSDVEDVLRGEMKA